MKQFPAFFVRIYTNFGKIIAQFVDSKYESTRNMKCKINGKEYTGKLTKNQIIFYYLDDKLIKCKYKHQTDSRMYSNDEDFLYTIGLRIFNNRTDLDFALVDDNYYDGIL